MKIVAMSDNADVQPHVRMVGYLPGIPVPVGVSAVHDCLVDLIGKFSDVLKKHDIQIAKSMVDEFKKTADEVLKMGTPVYTGNWPTAFSLDDTTEILKDDTDYSHLIGKTYNWIGVMMTVTAITEKDGQPHAVVTCRRPSAHSGSWEKLQPLPFPRGAERVDDDAPEVEDILDAEKESLTYWVENTSGGNFYRGVEYVFVDVNGTLWVYADFGVIIAGYMSGAWKSFGQVQSDDE